MKRKNLISLGLILAIFVSLFTFTVSATTAPNANGSFERQWVSKWKNVKVGGGTLYDTGCGIFSLVNAVYALNGSKMDIVATANWAHDIGAYNKGNSAGGTSRFDLYPKVTAKYGNTYGFKFVDPDGGQFGTWASASSNTLLSHLNKGGVAIAHVPNHFIALVGYKSSNSTILVYDSAPSSSRNTTKNGDWLTLSQLKSGKAKIDWFCLIENAKSSSKYFPACSSSYTSIVSALKSVGAESSYAYRKEIAAANNISNYSGTAAQNTQMLNLLKKGQLVKPGATSSVKYFPACGSGYTSIVSALNSVGAESSYAYRKTIAAANNISNYSGTAAQNTQMLNLLKSGKLIKP